jgi:ubiquinone/menaquinone biosynthesis C-methylase UbiE
MPWEYTDEYYREYTRTTWNESAEPYSRVMERLAPFRTELVRLLAARPGERVLDLGTGPGEPAMTIAQQVGPGGKVVGVDLAEGMIALAKRGAETRQLSNVDFQVMDSGDLKFEAGSFDAAVCAFGFQIFTDPEGAAKQVFRALRPGGRIAVCIWSTGDRVPFLDVLIAPMLEHAEPDASGYLPTPYETGGPGEMVAFLEKAGFRQARETRRQETLRFGSEQEYLDQVLKGTPIGHSLSEESPDVQRQVLRKTHQNLSRWLDAQGVGLPAECVFVTATRPA